MESRFGHDFSMVKVHKDALAAASAEAVHARAYTIGQNIIFGSGQYAPGAESGKQLLAHELQHTLQQGRNTGSLHSRFQIGPVNDTYEREADRAATEMDADTTFSHTARAGNAVLQRKPIHDPIHAPLIEDYRRQHGLPPGGVDEFGRRVGPSDAEIKYRMLPGGALLPVCPDVKNIEKIQQDFKDPEYRKIYSDTHCLSSSSQGSPPACRFSSDQMKMLETAQKTAAARAKKGLDRIGAGREGMNLAGEMAGRLFTGEPPTIREISTRLQAVSSFLSGKDVEFAGRTCGDSECQRGAVAYVTGPQALPIHICPQAFSEPSILYRTVLHESLHWTGLDADPSTPEGYCKKFDCQTPCLDKEVADAWAHYLECLGEPIKLRRSFREKILESVNEIP